MARRRRPAPAAQGGGGDEAELARAARNGDREAFGRLYELNAACVHGVLLALVPREDARDLVQDVFLLALRSITRLDQPERFGPWVCAIARNRARDLLKSRRASAELVEDPPAPSAADGADEAEEARRVMVELRALPEAYRETLFLRLVEGLGGPEIARRTGLTPGSVRVNLCRGMKLLRERLERAEGRR